MAGLERQLVERRRRKLGVDCDFLYIVMAEVGLDCPDIDALIDEVKEMAQGVRALLLWLLAT